jgi:predicted SAM-dependent methyltransferase
MEPIAAAPFDYSGYDRINFGCGYNKMFGYLNVDIDPACSLDVLLPSGDLSLLPKRHFAEVFAKDVLEHIPRGKSLDALLEFSSLLQDGGKLTVSTTSILDIAAKFDEQRSFAE